MRGAAKSPLAVSAIASESDDDIGLVEQAMLDYFPEVISLRIIPMGEMGTADFEGGSEGLRNHIEVDLVRRAGDGTATQPEAYQFEGRWMTSLAALVTHPRANNRQAVIIATIDNQLLSEQLKSAGHCCRQVFAGTGFHKLYTASSARIPSPWPAAEMAKTYSTDGHYSRQQLAGDLYPLPGAAR